MGGIGENHQAGDEVLARSATSNRRWQPGAATGRERLLDTSPTACSRAPLQSVAELDSFVQMPGLSGSPVLPVLDVVETAQSPVNRALERSRRAFWSRSCGHSSERLFPPPISGAAFELLKSTHLGWPNHLALSRPGEVGPGRHGSRLQGPRHQAETVRRAEVPRSDTLEDEEHKERLLREAQAAAALDHPNICTVYEIDEADGQTFLAMAHLEGEAVKEKIKSRPLKLDEALDIAIQTAQGCRPLMRTASSTGTSRAPT